MTWVAATGSPSSRWLSKVAQFGLLKRARSAQNSGMPENDAPAILILLYVVLGLLVILLGFAFGIRRRLARIERRLLAAASHSETSASAPSVAETSPGGAFESFLAEDPARRDLPKKEQFAEYRKWRQEKGMNWSNS
jgi:flagellar biosynthesis/type III secretory pathway M-ring protein FliF/YscJ